MNLIKTTFFTGIATIIQTISGFILSKIIAIQVGPSGLAFFAQFQNFVTMLMRFASGAINTGVVKYTSEFRSNDEEKSKIFSTALKICLIFSLFTFFCLLFGAEKLSVTFLKTPEYSFVFQIFAFTFFLFVLNNLILAILNGLQEIKKYTFANIASSLFGLIITGALVYKWSLKGGLIALATNQSIVFFVTLIMVLKSDWFNWSFFSKKIDKKYLKKLMKYTLMSLTTAFLAPSIQIYLRNHVGERLGWEQAGYWQAMLKISGAYLILINKTLKVYYLPKLSELQKKIDLKNEILYGFKAILPLLFIVSFFIYFLKDYIITILFTKDFLPMRELFAFQLIGDFAKISSWILANLILAKAMTKIFILSEILFCGSLILFSVYFVDIYGLIGLVYGYALNYLIYLFFMIFLFKDILFYTKNKN